MQTQIFLRKVWIPGGSRGIGLGLARQVLERSDEGQVWLSSRNVEENEHARKLVEQHGGKRVRLVQMNITDKESVQRAAQIVAEESENRMDAVINTVGLLHGGTRDGGMPEKRLRDIEPDWVMENFKVNSLGPLLLAQQVVENNLLNKSEWTVLANFSAKVGSVSDNKIGSWYSYRASKAAQNMVNKCVAIELTRMRRKTICVGIHPGTVDTDLSAPFSANVKHEVFSIDKAATLIVDVLLSLDPVAHNGKLLSWNGQVIDP